MLVLLVKLQLRFKVVFKLLLFITEGLFDSGKSLGAFHSTGGPRIVLFLRTQGTVLLTKPYYSGTDLVLK